MITVGILSDTHMLSCNDSFRHHINIAFSGCDAIIHAGDLTDISLLQAFAGKDLYAVHGNMCNMATRKALPEHRTIILDGYTLGICHGAGNRHNIEDRMLDLFPLTDCIIYGHTHIPVCHMLGSTLIINPGSFQATGRYGAPGTYALLKIDQQGLHASIHELPISP